MYVVYYYDVAMSMYSGEARLTAEIPQRDRLGWCSGFTPTCPPVNRIDSGRPMSMHTRKLVVGSVLLTGLVATTDKREASWGIHSSQGCLVDASDQQLSSV